MTNVQAYTRYLRNGFRKENTYPQEIKSECLTIMQEHVGYSSHDTDHIDAGQPFRLGMIQALAGAANDQDSDSPQQCKTGLPLGVDEPLPDTAHIWPSKTELTGVEQHETHQDLPHPTDNYPSAK